MDFHSTPELAFYTGFHSYSHEHERLRKALLAVFQPSTPCPRCGKPYGGAHGPGPRNGLRRPQNWPLPRWQHPYEVPPTSTVQPRQNSGDGISGTTESDVTDSGASRGSGSPLKCYDWQQQNGA
jgi:hypothetical protein